MATLTENDEWANVMLSNRLGADEKFDGECSSCNKYGHRRRDCQKLISDKRSGQKNGGCDSVGSAGNSGDGYCGDRGGKRNSGTGSSGNRNSDINKNSQYGRNAHPTNPFRNKERDNSNNNIKER